MKYIIIAKYRNRYFVLLNSYLMFEKNIVLQIIRSSQPSDTKGCIKNLTYLPYYNLNENSDRNKLRCNENKNSYISMSLYEHLIKEQTIELR